jgi:glutaredoxin-like protein NrdH
MSNVTVYSKPNCPQCTQTKKKLEQKGIAFEVIDISQDKKAAQTVNDLGYRQVPVVVSGEKHWSGFRPDLLSAL